jgi:hypothetical protein
MLCELSDWKDFSGGKLLDSFLKIVMLRPQIHSIKQRLERLFGRDRSPGPFLEIIVRGSQIYLIKHGRHKEGGFTPIGKIVVGSSIHDDVAKIGADIIRNMVSPRPLTAAEHADIGAHERAIRSAGFKDETSFYRKAKMVHVEEREDGLFFVAMKRRRGLNWEYNRELKIENYDPEELGKKLLEAIYFCV